MQNTSWNARQQTWSAYVEAGMQAKGFTRKRLAEIIGLSPETLRNWLRLRSRPSFPQVIEIAKVLDQEPAKHLEILGLIQPGYALTEASELNHTIQKLGMQIKDMERTLSDARNIYGEMHTSIQHLTRDKPDS